MRLSLIAAALASAVALCEGSTKMVIGYFPNWLYANYPVENIPFTKYTHINYAFAILNNPDNIPSFSDDWAIEAYLPQVVKLAHENKTKVLLSVGGWTGSKRFSPMVASADSRQKFIDWNLDFIDKYSTDGVDLDWEYPGKQAAGCNEFADNDADNFLLLLKELREALDTKYPDEHKEISMAVHVQPFIKSGVPMTDLKAFVPYFDHVNLMTYDINGAWASTTGPNAPFQVAEDGKGAPFSFVESIRDWKAAGVPSDKITAGLAFYGRSMKAQGDMTTNKSQFQDSITGAPKGDSDDAYWDDPYCNKEPGGLSGIWKWSNLRKEGLLKDDFVTPGEGWQRNWDEVSQTPWLFNPDTKNFISYDDPQSLNIKVEHAICEDLGGVMVWDIHQDNGELLDVVNKIHTAVPACSNSLNNDSSSLTTIDPDSANEEIPESADVNQEPTSTPVSSTPAAPTTESEWSGDADDLEDFYDDEEEINQTSSSLSSVTIVDAPASSALETPTSSVADTPSSSELGTPTSSVDDTYVSSELVTDTSSEIDTPVSSGLNTPTSSIPVTPVSTTSAEPDYTSSVQADPAIGSVTAIHGGPCTNSGHQMCLQSGESAQWLTCNFGKWLSRDCASGLVCYDGMNAGALYCDFPADIKAASAPSSSYSLLPTPSGVKSNDLPDAIMASPLLKMSPNSSV